MKDKISILGKEYRIIFRKHDEDAKFEELNCNGYCESYTKKIVVGDLKTFKGYGVFTEEELAFITKQIIRHEIVHAFLNESGLRESANHFEGSWADNEEMVDWIASKGEQIHEAWQQLGVLDN